MIKVVISGSYHKDSEGLARSFRELETTGCRILSPLSLNFTNLDTAVVKSSQETDFSTAELEKFHLRAIRDADFIWLHAPAGYVGTSGSFELGYATALGKPVFSNFKLEDAMLQTQVRCVVSVFEALEQLG